MFCLFRASCRSGLGPMRLPTWIRESSVIGMWKNHQICKWSIELTIMERRRVRVAQKFSYFFLLARLSNGIYVKPVLCSPEKCLRLEQFRRFERVRLWSHRPVSCFLRFLLESRHHEQRCGSARSRPSEGLSPSRIRFSDKATESARTGRTKMKCMIRMCNWDKHKNDTVMMISLTEV